MQLFALWLAIAGVVQQCREYLFFIMLFRWIASRYGL